MNDSSASTKMEIRRDITGSILDIGGGGEGIIGRIYGGQVVAIDNREEELDEAPDACEKRLMDATALQFPDRSFDHVTFFYALMYMNRDEQKKALGEAVRVLKPGGKIHLWDADIDSAYPEPFVVDLEIVTDRFSVHTSYGIVKKDAQDADTILRDLINLGLKRCRCEKERGQFLIVGEKASEK